SRLTLTGRLSFPTDELLLEVFCGTSGAVGLQCLQLILVSIPLCV
ncbi:hypothetical protein LINPERPRIM_LOCUS11557, partial [Linum perenne]